MASPYNASESEPADEEFIETGFDPLLFWEANRSAILVAAGVLLLAVIGFCWYEVSAAQRTSAAETALAAAASQQVYQQIIDRYAGTVAAGDASLLLADQLRHDKKYDEAAQVLNTFLAKYPAHPLVHAGLLSLAETLETQGKTDEALANYQEIGAKYSDSFSAPLAALAEANLLKSQGKIEEARRVYENFVAQFPESVFTNEAMGEMHILRNPAPGSGPAAAAPPAPQLPPATPNAAVPGSLPRGP